MNSTDAFALVKRILENELGVPAEKIVLGATLREDLEMDSLDRVEFVAALEGELGGKIDDDVVGQVHTVQHVVDAIGAAMDGSHRLSAS